MRAFFYDLSRNTIKCFKGHNLLWHVLAIVLTYFSVSSGFDWLYFEYSRNPILQSTLFPAVRLGGRLPVIVPLTLYIVGKVRNKLEVINTAFALGQSVLIGLLIAALYKAFTGRVHPPRLLTPDTSDISHLFQFGVLRGGVFWGWPSSHTTIAFAMAMTLFMLYPKNKILRCFTIMYALYIGIGVSISIHWFSDFVAGAIIGTVIGVVVGKIFLCRDTLQTNLRRLRFCTNS